MANLIYEGPVTIKSTDKDGNPLTIKSGQNAGKPWYRVSFKVGEDWINLADFAGKAGGIADGTVCKVAYSAKLDEFGEQTEYNGRPEWKLEGIKSTGQAPLSQGAAPAQQNGKSYDPGLGAYQTALNVSATVYAALIESGAVNAQGVDVVQVVIDNADRFHQYLVTGKTNELDQALEQAKAGLGGEELDDDLDDDIPFG